MTEKKREGRVSTRIDLSSKFWKILLTVLAALLTFIGPTYIPYVLLDVLKLNYALSMGSGIILFIVGLALIWYLIKNKVVS